MKIRSKSFPRIGSYKLALSNLDLNCPTQFNTYLNFHYQLSTYQSINVCWFQVDDLVSDLVDGTILVELVQALTGERLFGTIPDPQSKGDAITNIQVP